ncbi:MAG: ATP-grasp domain-containing protein [Planctomycetota bacterium]
MRPRRILAITKTEMVPPDDVEGIDIDRQIWKMDYDVISHLRKLGHEVRVLGVGGELGPIRDAIDEFQPHLAFNLLDDFDGEIFFDQNVVSYLELLGVPYSGCNPRGLILARDKALSKKILTYHRIPVPGFAVFRRGRKVTRPSRLEYPLIVKSLVEQASAGIAQTSVVYDDEALRERVVFVHERVGTDAIAESYIEGRELYVGVLGNYRLQVLPVWELLFGNLPERAPRIATAKVKFDVDYQEARGITNAAADDLDPVLARRIQDIAKRTYRVLDMNGYARIDIRLSADGSPRVLEANPNPQLAWGEEFAESAQRAGYDYSSLIQRIVSLGLAWQPRRSRRR